MAYLEWQNNQLHVLIPPQDAREAFDRLELPNDPLLTALWSQASGVKFEISGLLGCSAQPEMPSHSARR